MASTAESPIWFLKMDSQNNPTPEAMHWYRAMTGIKRYEGLQMVHRPDLYDHALRVAYIADYLGGAVYNLGLPQFNPQRDRIYRLAYHHDDEEFCTGDLPTPFKLAMNDGEKVELDKQEELGRAAIADFILTLPPNERQIYLEDRRDLKGEISLEAKIVKTADKLDAYGEKLHELRCGNKEFIETLETSRKVLRGLDRFWFWQTIKNDVLGGIPSDEKLISLPTISPDSFKTRDDLIPVLLSGKDDGWPEWYETWLLIQLNKFHNKDIERMILPGWHTELWGKWGIPIRTKTTRNGISVAHLAGL